MEMIITIIITNRFRSKSCVSAVASLSMKRLPVHATQWSCSSRAGTHTAARCWRVAQEVLFLVELVNGTSLQAPHPDPRFADICAVGGVMLGTTGRRCRVSLKDLVEEAGWSWLHAETMPSGAGLNRLITAVGERRLTVACGYATV